MRCGNLLGRRRSRKVLIRKLCVVLVIVELIALLLLFAVLSYQSMQPLFGSRLVKMETPIGSQVRSQIPNLMSNSHLDEKVCLRVIKDRYYAKKAAKIWKRIKMPVNLDYSSTECGAVRRRGIYADAPASEDEKQFPVAFARVVYRDYYYQELLLHAMYAPQNTFCYIIDKKASTLFRSQMERLASCFHNVFVSKLLYDVDSAGHNMLNCFMACLRLLLQKSSFEYAVLLQNDDVPLKTNRELVRILRSLDGANDLVMVNPKKGLIPKYDNWTFAALGLYNDASKNDARKLRIAKGGVESCLSRAFVEFLVHTLNVSTLIARYETSHYGMDEHFFPSLNLASLGAPGGFTHACLGKSSDSVTRLAIFDKSHCKTGKMRHFSCIFGTEDLPDFSASDRLFANKMLVSFDYPAISCWLQYLHKISRGEITRELDLKHYAQLSHVRYHRRWLREAFFNETTFACGNETKGKH